MGLFHGRHSSASHELPMGSGAKAQRLVSHQNCTLLGEMKGSGIWRELWVVGARDRQKVTILIVVTHYI